MYIVWGRGPVRGFGLCLCELCWAESFGGWCGEVDLNWGNCGDSSKSSIQGHNVNIS